MKDTGAIRNCLTLENLQIGYFGTWHRSRVVFGPVNVGVNHAEMIAIVGHNGVGKSTLLRTIAGLQVPIAGSIWLNNRELPSIHISELATLISFVSTETIATPHLSVHELIAIGRYPYTGWLGQLDERDRTMVTQASLMAGVTHLLHKSMHELSDGERQKVMIARALTQDTPFIILDEPTAFLDLPARFEIMRILHELTLVHNKTILFTTHDLAVAMDVADKLWIMADGFLHEGAPEDLIFRKVFQKLFSDSSAEFDARSLSFRFKRLFRHEVTLQGDKKYRPLTRKALERIGFHAVDESAALFGIEIIEMNGVPCWRFHRQGIYEGDFKSLYDLTVFMKTLP